jgi:hypothetical protein
VFYEYAADDGAFLREAADEIERLRDCEAYNAKSVAWANVEIERLREENEKLLRNAKQDAEMMVAYNLWCQKNKCAPSSSNLIEMMTIYKRMPSALQQKDDE